MMDFPKQAVILCGGRGERLRPLTDRIPKALAPVLGRAYLDYLIDELHDEGIEQIVLLTGYMAAQIAAHVGDGKRFGVDIQCLQGPPEWESGKRLAEAKHLLAERFVLLYCDNYAPFRLELLWEFHQRMGLPVTVTLAEKEAGNFRLGKDRAIEAFDFTRRRAGLNQVEIGYMMVERDLVMPMNPARGSFSVVLGELAAEARLAAFAPGHTCYCSVSDLKRLRETEEFFSPRRLLLLDRDGVINQKAPRGEYIWRQRDFKWIPQTLIGLQQLAEHGFEFIILSNQAGIGRGMVPAQAVTDLHAWMVEEMGKQGIRVKDILVCPHHWEDHCICRKPLPALFYWASGKHRFWLQQTLYVGDDLRDAMAARNAGCGCLLVGEDQQLCSEQTIPRHRQSSNLLEAVPWIMDQFCSWESTSRGRAACS